MSEVTKYSPLDALDDSALIEDFCKDCELQGMTPETIRRYGSSLRIFEEFLSWQNTTLLDVDRAVLKDFISYLRNERNNSSKTVNNNFSALSSFYEYLVYERLLERNPVLEIRRRYLGSYKSNPGNNSERKLISIEEMKMLIDSILNPRDKAIITLLAKTGIRRNELINIDLDDINWENQSITLKPTRKRTNLLVFFDDECARILRRWLRRREVTVKDECKALFVSTYGNRIDRNAVYHAATKHAERLGLHDQSSSKTEDHFSPHCCRHWFTTHLIRAGMPREYVKELRGDARGDAIDIYHHIDREELRESYLAHIPQLGI
ncbi:MAG: tyrosine-type recombinase/integrase [Halobacteriota archaeon]|nr:tyrosine-type recombinase/integrase [Halobacteriota archaeon]